MNDLIERLQKATGPDLHLDHLIALAVQPADGHGVLLYTASIDAALTLVPEGGRVREIGQWDDNGKAGGWFACVTRWLKTTDGWESREFTYGIQDPMDFHPKVPPLAFNGAIALCIAALKAREAIAQSSALQE